MPTFWLVIVMEKFVVQHYRTYPSILLCCSLNQCSQLFSHISNTWLYRPIYREGHSVDSFLPQCQFPSSRWSGAIPGQGESQPCHHKECPPKGRTIHPTLYANISTHVRRMQLLAPNLPAQLEGSKQNCDTTSMGQSTFHLSHVCPVVWLQEIERESYFYLCSLWLTLPLPLASYYASFVSLTAHTLWHFNWTNPPRFMILKLDLPV